MSERPTKPAPRPIAPRPVAAGVRAALEAHAQEIVHLARVYSGTQAARRRSLEVAHQLGLPDAASLAADLLTPSEAP